MRKLLVAFDLDDTLYPEKNYVFSGFKAVSQLMKNHLGINNIYPELVKTFNMGERRKTFNFTLERLGIKYNEVLLQKMVDCYRKHFPNIKPYNDVVPTLRHLKNKYTLVLITDGYLQSQKNKIASLNIDKFFKKILYTDEYGRAYWKPNLGAFQIVMEYFSVNGDNCVYVGDNIEKDFFAPNQLGWETIQIKRKNGLYSNSDIFINEDFAPRVRIHSLLELKEILK